jgi:hypothetical protein
MGHVQLIDESFARDMTNEALDVAGNIHPG